MRAAFRKIDVTPEYAVSLLGYFNDRVSTGVSDPLYCRLAAFAAAAGGRRAPRVLFVQIDTCVIANDFAHALGRALRGREAGGWRGREVLVFASHTHTAPALMGLYEVPPQKRYAAELIGKIAAAAAALAAELSEAPAVSLAVARGRAEALAFNRRWLQGDGRVLTNPPRSLRAPPARPEGPVDPEVNSVLVRDGTGELQALLVSAVNHTDTIGGERISADWTGVMEREIGRALGREIPVFPILGAQGNINHFDPSADRGETCYEEAQRLGRSYAAAVLASLPAAAPEPACRGPALAATLRRVRVPGRRIVAGELAEARALLAGTPAGGAGETLTASELAAGSETVRRVLARELLRAAPARRRSYRLPLQSIRLGGVLFLAIPGEAFVEIGLELKRLAVRKPDVSLVVPVGLANGYYGYILPEESLRRGGYEALPVAGCLGAQAAKRILTSLVGR